MKQSTQGFPRSTFAAGIALTTLMAFTGVQAEPVFPPSPHAPQAKFAKGVQSAQPLADAWYHEMRSAERARLVDAEVQQLPPYPAMYYFIKLRNSANDEDGRLSSFASHPDHYISNAVNPSAADKDDS